MSIPRIESVFGIIFSDGGEEIILIKRRDVSLWVLPGGGVDSGETPEECVIREMKEETGLEVEITRQVAHYIPSKPFLKSTNLYSCRIVGGTLKKQMSEVKEVQFFSLKELPFHLMPPPFPEFIEDSLQSGPTLKKGVTSITPFSIVKNILFHPIYAARFILSRFGLHINT